MSMENYGKQHLFEMMNRVVGMPIMGEKNLWRPNLPTWAQSAANDFILREKYEELVPCLTDLEEVECDLNAPLIDIEDPQKWLGDKDIAISKKQKQNVDGGGRLSTFMLAQSRKGDYNMVNY